MQESAVMLRVVNGGLGRAAVFYEECSAFINGQPDAVTGFHILELAI